MSPARDRHDALALFAVLWALGALFHLAKWSLWAESPASLAMTVAVVLVLASPGAILPLAGLFFAQVWALALDMPMTSNHLLLSGVVGALGLLATGRVLLRTGGRADRGLLHDHFAPPARAVLLLVFLFAGLAKLNADWVRPEVSCGAILHRTIVDRIPLLPGGAWAQWTAIVGAVAIELTVPFLLLSRRLRLAGILLGAVFLFAVGIAGFFNFAAITAALLLLFAPENTGELLREACRRSPTCTRIETFARSPQWRRIVRLGAAAIAGTALVVAVAQPWAGYVPEPLLVREIPTGRRPTVSLGFEAAGWILVPALVATLLLALRAGEPRWPPARRLLAHPSPALALVPLFVLLNGIAPYLGWKTEATFGMFSNLRTETAPNHWLIRPLDPLGLQGDLAAIESSSDPELGRLAERGEELPMSELRAYVRRRSEADGPDFTLTYVRDGRRRAVQSAGRDPELTRAASPPVRWLVAFRPVSPTGPNPCRH